MSTVTRLTALLAAILLLSAAAASANRYRIPLTRWETTWERLEFAATTPLGNSTISCPTTIEGSFHSSNIVKTPGSLIGYVARASVASNCTGGHTTVLTATLPWHVTYEGFTGTLPLIRKFRVALLNVGFQIENGRAKCLARSEINHPLNGTLSLASNGVVTTVEAEANRLPLSGEPICEFGATGELLPSLGLMSDGVESPITVRLI